MENLTLGTQFLNTQNGKTVQLVELDTDGESWFTFKIVLENGELSKSYMDVAILHRREL